MLMTEKVQQSDETKIPLRRVLGLGTAILLVAGNIIGTGVFKKIVPMAASGLSKPEILLAWIAAGGVALTGAFTFAGLSRVSKQSGGLYEYMRLAFGKFAGFIMGWSGFSISLSGALAAVAFIFAQSVNSMVHLPDPLQQWSGISLWSFIYPFDNSGVKILAMATIAVLTWFNYRGVRFGSGLNSMLTSLKIIGILALIVMALLFTGSVTQTRAIENNPSMAEAGYVTAFFGAVLSAFWAYDGFTNITYIAGEVKRPKRNLPIAIIFGVCLVMVLYVLINNAYMTAVPVHQLGALEENQIAATYIAGNIMGAPGATLISLLIMLSSFGTLNVMVLFYARLYYRMAQENVFFRNAAKVHPAFRTPYIALRYSMVWSMVLVLSGTFDMLTDMSILMSFIFYSFLAVGLIKFKRQNLIRDKIPCYPLAPVLFILFAIIIAANTFITQPRLSAMGIGLAATGIPCYFYFKWKYKGLPVVQNVPGDDQ